MVSRRFRVLGIKRVSWNDTLGLDSKRSVFSFDDSCNIYENLGHDQRIEKLDLWVDDLPNVSAILKAESVPFESNGKDELSLKVSGLDLTLCKAPDSVTRSRNWR